MNGVYHVVKPEDLIHYGVLGMKWGKWRARRKTDKLYKHTKKRIRQFDKGKGTRDDLDIMARMVRKQRYKFDKKINRAQKWLDKADKADLKLTINRYNKDPEKRRLVRDFMEHFKKQNERLSDMRMGLIDARM